MTKDGGFKRRVRRAARDSGQRYTEALAAIQAASDIIDLSSQLRSIKRSDWVRIKELRAKAEADILAAGPLDVTFAKSSSSCIGASRTTPLPRQPCPPAIAQLESSLTTEPLPGAVRRRDQPAARHLTVRLDGREVTIHVLDTQRSFEPSLRALEARIADLVGE